MCIIGFFSALHYQTGSSAGKQSTCNAGDPGSNSWLGKSPWRRDRLPTPVFLGFPGGSDVKESACNAGDPSSSPWVGKIPWRRDRLPTPVFLGLPLDSAGKESTCNARDLGVIPGLGRSPGGGNGYTVQYSGLDNSMETGIQPMAGYNPWGREELDTIQQRTKHSTDTFVL